jgi:hypothetical protein
LVAAPPDRGAVLLVWRGVAAEDGFIDDADADEGRGRGGRRHLDDDEEVRACAAVWALP